ncbi:MAG: cation:proton antiporter [Saprospirales bacterium]|nr:cation:proton antiporter [Saprospirales bacterium]
MKWRNIIFYATSIGGLFLLINLLLIRGRALEAGRPISSGPSSAPIGWQPFLGVMENNVMQPISLLLIQIIVIIVVARVFGFILRKIGHPSVIGEILAGIFLGPSFIGYYFPEFYGFVFPSKSLANIQFLSQVGLILFMFVVGMELDLKIMKNKIQEAVVVSHTSIILPFFLGVGLAWFLYEEFSRPHVPFLSFALFMGIAMSVSAFPVLARIVQERGLTKTPLGGVVITAAAVDDITAWCIFAAVIAIVKAGSVVGALYTIGLAICYVILFIKVVQPFLKKISDVYSGKEGLSKPVVAVFFITLLISSLITEAIGIHVLFGAFMAGVIMPAENGFRRVFIEKVEDVSLVLLMPLFFVFTGLRTQIEMLNEPFLWQVCALICLVAMAGKFGGSALAARFIGHPWRESLIIGALLNTRGLMELVVLNIGYDLGILNPKVFAMLVIMALLTTMLTGPALNLINRFLPEKKPVAVPKDIGKYAKFKILIAFSNPEKGRAMLRLAHSLIKKSQNNALVTALHISPGTDLNLYNAEEYERESFQLIREEARKLDLGLITLFKPANDIDREVIETANLGDFDLLIIGIGKSVYEGTLLGRLLGFTTQIINPERLYQTLTGKEKFFEYSGLDDRTRYILRSVKIPVGILLYKGLPKIENVFIPFYGPEDSFLLAYGRKLIHDSEAKVVILDVNGAIRQDPELKESIRSIEQIAPQHIALYDKLSMNPEWLHNQDLMLISLDGWRKNLEKNSLWLSQAKTVFILKP